MESFIIDESLKNTLTENIRIIIKKYSKDSEVEAILLNCYRIPRGRAFIDITVVGENKKINNTIKIDSLDLRRNNDIKVNRPLIINIFSRSKNIFDIESEKYINKEACIDLYNSDILYDRFGKFTALKESIKNKYSKKGEIDKIIYGNNIEFLPPLPYQKREKNIKILRRAK